MPADLTEYLVNLAQETILSIRIYFVPEDVQKILRALDRVESKARFQANETPRLMAMDYYAAIIQNIVSGKYVAGYAKYHPRYQAWKAKQGAYGSPSYWRLFGDLIKAMTVMRVGDPDGHHAYFSGVPNGVFDSGGKSWFGAGNKGRPKEIAWYGRVMEEGLTTGTQHHRPRALFWPTFKEYRDGKAVERGEQGLQGIAARWR